MLLATVKGMLGHKLRLILTASSIALGVAFLAGTLMLTDSMERAFDEMFADATSGTDVVVRAESDLAAGSGGDRPPLPGELLQTVRTADGVAVAEGSVSGYALLTGSDGKPIQPQGAPTTGTSMPGDPGLRGDLTLRSGRAPQREGEVVIDATSAEKGDLAVGDETRVLFQHGPETFTVVGVAGLGEQDDLGGSTTAFFDLATAQRVLGKVGVFDSVVVKATDGISDEALADSVGGVLPSGTEALTGAAVADEQSAAVKDSLAFVNVALIAFAGIALFVGSFIIWNTFSMQVAQRSRELALMRAVGATRGQVMRAILTESVVLGVAASLIGVALGVGMAQGLAALMTGFGWSIPTAGVRFGADAVLVGLLVGTVVTVVSAIAPARRATRVLPVEALRDATPQARGFAKARLVAGVVALAGSSAVMGWALFGSAPTLLVPAGMVGVVLGTATLAPLLTRPLVAAIGAPLRARGVTAVLARQNALRNPRRTASTAMALVIGLTMVAAVAVFGASLKASFADVLASTKADLYVLTPTSQSEGFSREATEAVREVEGVAVVSRTGYGMAEIDGTGQGFSSIEPATVDQAFDLAMVSGSPDDLGLDGVLVHADVADQQDLAIGDPVPAAFGGTGARQLEVVGVFGARGFVGADYVISTRAHDVVDPQRLESTALVVVEDGESVAAVEQRIADVLTGHPDTTVMDREEFKGALGSVIDQLMGLVTVLLLLAVVIALLGIVNTLALSVFERTRELGMLRAVGMTRGQVRAMVRWESVVISTIGAVMGATLGIGLGLALTRAMADEGINQVAVPGVQLTLYVVAAAVAGVVAAIGPARRASKVDVLRAVVTE
ncbi:MAG TPA: FtsX-like permease family protein [Nocardioidaceae bacterium]|nr:FtsX-like permease family protein [Nocardioidaceae bacterium]